MKRIVLGVVIVFALGLVSGYFWLNRQFERQLETLASELASHGRLSWDRVSIGYSGKATVHRLRFEPYDSRDRILLEELVLNADSIGGLAHLARRLDNGLLPSSLRISVRSLNVPVNRQISEWIGPFNPGLPFASAGCGDFDPFVFFHLGDIDLIGATLDLLIDYRIINQGEDLDLRLVASASQLTESNVHLRLQLNEPSRSIREIPNTLGRTRLISGSHTFTDLGFYSRLMEMCAQHTDQDVDDYINYHINAWIQRWAEHGREPGRLPLVAYRHFLLQPGTLTFTTEPDPAPDMETFSRARFTQLVGEIPIRFAVEDGAPVDLNFAPIEPPPEPVVAPAIDPEEEADVAVIADEDPPVAVGPSSQWQLIDVAQIGNYIDHRATITTVDGTRFRGVILEIEDDAVYLSIQTRQGLLMRPLPIRSIEEVRVRN
jgi:hypothetical protein